ncbi:MAG: acyl-CoA thioesterase [Pseudomonadota bacterium]
MIQEKSQELLDLLQLEQIEINLFRGQNEARMGARLFGGQVLAQALAAAAKTLEPDRPCHSLHAYFMRPGDADIAVVYNVERIRDGRSFTTRRIKAIQKGEAIFSMDASFQRREEGLEHQIDMQPFPAPAELEDDLEVARRMPDTSPMSGWATRERAFDIRSVYPMDKARPDNNLNPVWVRFRQPVTDGQWMHQCLLA